MTCILHYSCIAQVKHGLPCDKLMTPDRKQEEQQDRYREMIAKEARYKVNPAAQMNHITGAITVL